MVNWVIKKKTLLFYYPKSIIFSRLLDGVNIGKDSASGDGMYSSPDSASEHFIFCFGKR